MDGYKLWYSGVLRGKNGVGGYNEVHGSFGFGERNGGGISLLDFAKAFDLVIANSSFMKRDEHLVTYQSSVAKTQIDYLLLRRCDRRLCKDCKVIPSDTLSTQHRLLLTPKWDLKCVPGNTENAKEKEKKMGKSATARNRTSSSNRTE
ncbi:uncharacterized protein [Nicotiana sylvestris]|uniref:uncharacterized protein n=1 Tax=Nicotiana sylvestris TaxID=4096 RepID=UPI00388C9616